MQCIESSQSAYCVAQDKNQTSMCVSPAIADDWLQKSVFDSEFVNRLSQYLRPYVNISGSMACGCSDVTNQACPYDVYGCASDPCQNGGVCLDRINGYQCECRRSVYDEVLYFGVHCETHHGWCNTNPCQNGGTCVTDGGRTSCSCESGFEGDFCQNVDCMSNPCLHGGICINELLNHHCNCSDTGYTGINCEIDINECASNPCLYGNCTDKLNKYECNCYSGLAGENCDMINVCASDTCLNNGTCLFDFADKSYKCYCTDEFAGLHCELKVIGSEDSDEMNETTARVYITIGVTAGGLVLTVIIAGVILFSRRYLCQTRSSTATDAYTALNLVPMLNDDATTAENNDTQGRLSAYSGHYDEITHEVMTPRSADDATYEYRSSAQYDEIHDRNLHIETGNDVISSQYLTPPSGASQAGNTDRQTDENDDDYLTPISSNCTKYDTNSADPDSDSYTDARSKIDTVDVAINDESAAPVAGAASDDVTPDEHL